MGVEPNMAMFGARRPQAIHPLRSARQGHAADLVQTGQIAQSLQIAVRIDGIAPQGGHVSIGVESVECAGGVPRRPGGQLRSLQQNDIAPAEFSLMKQHQTVENTATNHHHTCMGFHNAPLVSLFSHHAVYLWPDAVVCGETTSLWRRRREIHRGEKDRWENAVDYLARAQ